MEAGPDLWPIPWVSPRHALFWISLLLVPTLQGVTGMLLLRLAAGDRQPPEASRRWDHVVLAAVLPLAVAWTAVRWLGVPRAALALERAAWPAFAGIAVGLVVLAACAVVQARRGGPSSRPLTSVAASAGALAIASWALVQSFQIDPGAWLETRSLRLAVQPPALAVVLPLHAACTFALGAGLALIAGTRRPRLARTAAAVAAASGCVVLLAMPWWLPPHGISEAARRLSDQGADGPAWTARWSIVALFAFASVAVVANFLRGTTAARAGVLIAALAACASVAVVESHRGPYSVRGWRYANGIEVEQVRTFRRSPVFGKVEREEDTGAAVFRLQCAACHARSGPLASWRRELGCDATAIRSRLEALREADRLGHPDRGVMPPLIGSDREVDALAGWIRGGNPCP